ncbi:solute carrier family 25 member 45-like isoform X2 [Lineus longissimus]
MVSCFKKISSSNLGKGFYRGLTFPLLSSSFINSIFFGVYGNTLNWLKQGNHEKKDTRHYFDVFVAGAVAGAATVIPACPIEVVKVMLQSQIKSVSKPNEKYYRGPWHCLKSIFKESGIRGCYRGLSVHFHRDFLPFGVYMISYEWLHDRISEQAWADERGVAAGLIAGGIAGVIIWGCGIPVDYVKSRLQSDTSKKYKGTVDCVVKSYKSGGIRTFFKGGAVVCLRAFPVNAVTFFVYREILNELNKVNPGVVLGCETVGNV